MLQAVGRVPEQQGRLGPQYPPGGLQLGGGATPVPSSPIVCGLPRALSLIETLLLKSPSVVGVKVTLIVQVAPAATLEPQVLVWRKGGATATPFMWSPAEPVLLSVMDWPVLAVPTT